MTESREVLWFTLFCTGTAAAPRDFNALSAFQGKRKKCVTFLRQGDNVPTFRNGSVGKDTILDFNPILHDTFKCQQKGNT